MSAAREILARFGVSFDTHELKAGHDKVEETIGSLKHLGHAMAGVFAFHQIEQFVQSTVDAAAELKRASRMLGISTGEMQDWQHAADMSGVAAETLTTGLRFLGRNAYEAAHGGQAQAEVFTRLGVSVKDADGKIRPITDLLDETAEKFKGIEDPAEKLNTAMKLFGRGGAQMVPMLNRGSEGLKEFRGQVEELGGGFNEDFLALTTKFSQHEKQLGMLKRSISAQLVGLAIPHLMAWGHQMEGLGKWILRANKNGELLQATSVAFIGYALVKLPVLAQALRHMNWQLILAVAKFALVAFAVQDVLTWFRGGKSVIGEFFGEMHPGVRAAAQDLEEFLGFAVSSTANLKAALARIPSAIGMAITVTDNEIDIWLSSLDAKILDWWDGILRGLHVPNWLAKVLGSDSVGDESGTGNQRGAAGAADASRARLGGEFSKELEGGSWAEFRKAAAEKRAADQAEKGWAAQGFDASKGQYHWNAGLGRPEQTQMPVAPASIARPSTVDDHSTTTIQVTVPGTTPSNIASKTANATAREVRNANRAALGSLEHQVEG
jgi:hypothetical protein